MSAFRIPDDFGRSFDMANAPGRLDQVVRVANKIAQAGIELKPNLDHAAIFTDPPYLVAGPIKELGYISGWDFRCYPSPVDGNDYINVSARLPDEGPARDAGWPDYIAVVHPVDEAARRHMLSQDYGNPFIHHLTLGVVAPEPEEADDLTYAGRLIRFMADARRRIQQVIGEKPGTLIMALPGHVRENTRFQPLFEEWIGDLPEEEYQLEAMEGGGFLLQFFVLEGGRIEVALRVGTRQTFNPKSVVKISRDEISAVQE